MSAASVSESNVLSNLLAFPEFSDKRQNQVLMVSKCVGVQVAGWLLDQSSVTYKS